MRDAPSKPMTPDTDAPDDPTPAPIDPAAGLPDMHMPGADRPNPAPDPEDGLPQRLGKRIDNGPGGGIAAGQSDLLPNVEIPDTQM